MVTATSTATTKSAAAVVVVSTVVLLAAVVVLTAIVGLIIVVGLVIIIGLVVVVVLAAVVVVLAIVVVLTAAVVVVVIVVGGSDGELVAVILSTTLGDGHQDGLVVGGGEHGADTVIAGGQTTSDGSGEETVAVAGIVDALEEDEAGGVKGLVRGQRAAQVLDSDVSVANDVALAIEVLGGGVVGALSVSERARGEVVDLDLDVKVLVGLDVSVVRRVAEDGRDHAVLGGNAAHGDTVAATPCLLLTVGDVLALAEVDEVGLVAGQRG